MPPFTFLTNHGHALLAIAHDPRIRMREIAEVLGVTESRVSQIHSRALYRLNRALTTNSGSRTA